MVRDRADSLQRRRVQSYNRHKFSSDLVEVVAVQDARGAMRGVVAGVWEIFWEIALGIVVLWLFFLVMGAVALGDPAWLTIAMAVLAAAAIAHYVHIRQIVESDGELARRAHALRERRGF